MTTARIADTAWTTATRVVGRTFTARLLATTASVSMAAAPALAASSVAAEVAQRETQNFDIPAQPLAQALLRFSRETGIELFFDDVIARGINSPGVRGSFAREDALRRILAGTGLTYRFTNANTATLQKPAAASGAGVMQLSPVTVEGTVEPRFGDAPPETPGFKATYQTGSTKSPMPIRETPQAVTVTTRESIDARQARDINTALELTAGVTSGISSGGGPFAGPSPRVADQFSLRGQRLDGDRDVRIDGFAAGA
ncbi:MAG TPA: secretin and TonB N-terminal domain-containing protein, partial [Alphaproteobacteria bacterium]|nr:secretin and TonB N-terminal domain-containing protein [Alphaproteobacteria bacterium]